MNNKRIEEIDFIKCVLILLMVTFHLVYIGNTYPLAKSFVYTFHMPCFLVLSGYLFNLHKPPRAFGKSMFWLAVPYLLMESGYILMASVLPIREHIDNLTPGTFADLLLLHPIGPYWYLHTLILCSTVYFALSRWPRIGLTALFVLAGVLLYALSQCHLVVFSNALYFLLGAFLRKRETAFSSFFLPSPWLFLPFAIACLSFSETADKTAVSAIAVYCALCTLPVVYKFLMKCGKGRISRGANFIGRHTLLIFLFSPIFTILAKSYQPLLVGLDPSGMLFLLVSLAFAVTGSLLIGILLDHLRLSRFIFGKRQMIG